MFKYIINTFAVLGFLTSVHHGWSALTDHLEERRANSHTIEVPVSCYRSEKLLVDKFGRRVSCIGLDGSPRQIVEIHHDVPGISISHYWGDKLHGQVALIDLGQYMAVRKTTMFHNGVVSK